VKNDFTQGSERGTYVRLDTSRSEGTWDDPPGREAQGYGAWILLVGATPDQGGQESWPQGEAKQVSGVFKREVSEMEKAKTGRILTGNGYRHWRAPCLETCTRRSEEGRGRRAA
jgi:hypothetical protein